MSALTSRILAGVCRYDVGGKPGVPLEFLELVNQAGQFLVSAYPWRWLEGRSITLRRRARISMEGATWTEATKTLTKVGAFADYGFVSGDTARVLAGTGATLGSGYEVASRTSDDAIVLRTSIGSAANGQTDIEAGLPNDQIELAPDFELQAVIAIQAVNGTVSTFDWTAAQGMLDLRSWPNLRSTSSFWGWLNYVRSVTGGAPLPRLELWPEADDSEEFVRLIYRGGWLSPTSDTMALSLPEHMNLLFIELLKAVVAGYEDPEDGSIGQRLAAVAAGPLFAVAYQRDAMLQPDLGGIENGWLMGSTSRVGRYDTPTPAVQPAS